MQHQRVSARRRLAGALALAVAVVAPVAALPSAGADHSSVSFAADVQPLLERKCVSCHPVSYPYLDLRRRRAYEELVRAAARTAPAFERVVPGRPELSYLLTHPPDPSLRDLLSPGERELLADWIRQGAQEN